MNSNAKLKIKTTSILIFCYLTLPVFGQNQQNSLGVNLQKSIAFLPPENKMEGNVFGFEIIYKINTLNKNLEWAKILHVQSVDVILNYKNMQDLKIKGIPNKFGDSYAGLAGLNISLLQYKSVQLQFAPALGIGYSGKTFFTDGNELIGSHINFFSSAALSIETRLNKNTKLSTGITALHYSNAAIRVPNLGTNAGYLSIGIIKNLNTTAVLNTINNDKEKPQAFKKYNLELSANFGKRGVYKAKGSLFKTGFYGGFNYKINRVFGLGTGFDAVYYHTVYNPDKINEPYQSNASSFDRWRLGYSLGPTIWLGNFGIEAKYGFYIYYNNPQNNKTYMTTGLKYRLSKHFDVQAKMYVHKVEADHVGFGLSYYPFSR